jgi:hypothetical protein
LTITDQVPIGLRLAIRIEGKHANAYIASTDDTIGAIYLGSLLTALCRGNTELFRRWTELMGDAVSTLVEEIYGQRPTLVEQQPPAHEMVAGNG